jgi:hypothetical protein
MILVNNQDLPAFRDQRARNRAHEAARAPKKGYTSKLRDEARDHADLAPPKDSQLVSGES